MCEIPSSCQVVWLKGARFKGGFKRAPMFCTQTNVRSQTIIYPTPNQNQKKILNVGPEFLILRIHIWITSKGGIFAGLLLGLGILDTALHLIQCLCNNVHSCIASLKPPLNWGPLSQTFCVLHRSIFGPNIYIYFLTTRINWWFRSAHWMLLIFVSFSIGLWFCPEYDTKTMRAINACE